MSDRDDPAPSTEIVGGKGASIARLTAAGLPVPPWFAVTTAAYRRFVSCHSIEPRILDVVSRAKPGDSRALEAASAEIAGLFLGHHLPDDIVAEVGRAHRRLVGRGRPVAVRSSSTGEDLPGMSAAGQQETYLDVFGEEAVIEAMRRCWASLWTARAIAYRAILGVPNRDVSMAVIVQEMVPADVAGVLFTADPITGELDRMVVNAARGLGESLVGGSVTPDVFIVDRASGKLLGRGVRGDAPRPTWFGSGATEGPAASRTRRQASLRPSDAARLARVGLRIEGIFGRPMDIEWALRAGRISVLQARPITPSRGLDRAAGQRNDSLIGDFLWTNGNLAEAVPDVMTTCTWSIVKRSIDDAMAMMSLPGIPLVGNIGGRLYLNLSALATIASACGMTRRFEVVREEVFCRLPKGVEAPLIAASRWRILVRQLLLGLRIGRRLRACRARRPKFLAEAPGRVESIRDRIRATEEPATLVEIWKSEIAPLFREACHMVEAAGLQDGGALVAVRSELRELVGDADANDLLRGTGPERGALASLRPLIGLKQLAEGKIDRQTYLKHYGHRGPHEFEISLPRPSEDPAWLERLACFRSAEAGVGDLPDRMEGAGIRAWERLRERFPRKESALRRKVARWSAAARDREAARSELARVYGLIRDFVLRAGAVSGEGDALFHLSIDEILALLGGDTRPLGAVPVRRAAHDRHQSLPAYPALIRGAFDPIRWAADPDRQSDFFDARGRGLPSARSVTGSAAAAGVVEGRVRLILRVEDGGELLAGEILVTTSTNIGWTPIFPIAAAIVADVGAPLSHAAIVARELGIPAVVGCGNATMRLRTGDLVRVDGGKGTVEILETLELDPRDPVLIAGG